MVQLTYKCKRIVSLDMKAIALLTLIIPSVVFLLTHVRLVFGIPCSVFMVGSVALCIRENRRQKRAPFSAGDYRTNQVSLLLATVCLLVAALWTFLFI